jgi:YbgC/YbaW family acyl-CoA thioester hydrolase
VDRARWSDVDAAGIVCYGAYLRFFELAETELFRASGLTVARLQEQFALWLVRRRVECDFYRSIRLDEEVEVFAHAVAIGRTSLELAFAVRRLGDRELAVEARYILVAVDHEGLRPVPVPGAVREALAPWVLGRAAAPVAEISDPQ